jgi:hypothetical protein
MTLLGDDRHQEQRRSCREVTGPAAHNGAWNAISVDDRDFAAEPTLYGVHAVATRDIGVSGRRSDR